MVHDFMLYHFHLHGRRFDEILDLALLVFETEFDAETLRVRSNLCEAILHPAVQTVMHAGRT